jgi:hypothetical protein
MRSSYQFVKSSTPGGLASGTGRHSREFVERIQRAYRLSLEQFRGVNQSQWEAIGNHNADIHDALLNNTERLAEILDDPSQGKLFYGFENLFDDLASIYRNLTPIDFQNTANFLAEDLTRLSEAVGTRRIWNEEAATSTNQASPQLLIDADNALAKIERRIGYKISFPSPYSGELGLLTSRGVVSYRAIQAVYQAWRMRQLADSFGTKMLEIGAGLGRTAYFASRFKISDVTIVDIPMTNVAQASFLGHALGPDAVTLFGETDRPGCIRIMPPEWLGICGERFNIVLNADSMTEMAVEHACEYAEFIVKNADVFVSINHEANPNIVRNFGSLKSVPAMRWQYWMRSGYIEEIYFCRRNLAGSVSIERSSSRHEQDA